MKKLAHKNLLDLPDGLGFLGNLPRPPTFGHFIDPLFVDEAVGFGCWSRILHTF